MGPQVPQRRTDLGAFSAYKEEQQRAQTSLNLGAGPAAAPWYIHMFFLLENGLPHVFRCVLLILHYNYPCPYFSYQNGANVICVISTFLFYP